MYGESPRDHVNGYFSVKEVSPVSVSVLAKGHSQKFYHVTVLITRNRKINPLIRHAQVQNLHE